MKHLFASLLFLGTATLAFSGTFTNGSFESPGGAPIRNAFGCPDSSTVTGWLHDSAGCNGFEIYESSGADGINAADGTYYVSWGHLGSTGGTLQQTFDTVIGQAYNFTYELTTQQSGCGLCDQSNNVAVFDASNNLINSVNNTIVSNDGVWGFGAPLNFTATSTSTTVIFTDTTVDSTNNWALDAVSLNLGTASTTPEPASFGFLAIGLLGIPAVKRLRAR